MFWFAGIKDQVTVKIWFEVNTTTEFVVDEKNKMKWNFFFILSYVLSNYER